MLQRARVSRGGAQTQGPLLYHQLVVHGNTVYLAGQTAASLEPKDGGDSYTGQAQQVFAQIDALLQQAGSSRYHMLHVLVHLKSMSGLDAFNTAWHDWLAGDLGSLPVCIC